MCRLKLKFKLAGSKYHKFKKLIVIPRNFFINSIFKKKLGIWDTRKNKYTRYITINIFYLLNNYKYGLTPNKKTLNLIYYYFLGKNNNKYNNYFSKITLNTF